MKKKPYRPKPYEGMQYPGAVSLIRGRDCIGTKPAARTPAMAFWVLTRNRALFLRGFSKNGFEFAHRFSNSRRDLETLFEAKAKELRIRRKLIRPCTPRHSGKAERSHREDQKRFCDTHRLGRRYHLCSHRRRLAVCSCPQRLMRPKDCGLRLFQPHRHPVDSRRVGHGGTP